MTEPTKRHRELSGVAMNPLIVIDHWVATGDGCGIPEAALRKLNATALALATLEAETEARSAERMAELEKRVADLEDEITQRRADELTELVHGEPE